uniref:Uncharacterized protein n=1 Tax=Acrobeloides nanus TaxID=290746 RepID=A0A914E4I8_9BILA
MGKKDVRILWTVAAALGIPTRRRPIAQGRRNPELDPRQRARVHRSRHKPPKKQRRVATEFPGFEHLDYSLWSILKAEACSKPHQSAEALKKSLVKAWNAIPQ